VEFAGHAAEIGDRAALRFCRLSIQEADMAKTKADLLQGTLDFTTWKVISGRCE
jgi:hypothetical protein